MPVTGLILGIDPGLAGTGFGVIDDGRRVVACGTIQTEPGPAGARLLRIARELEALLGRHRVGEAALEELFLGRNRSSAIGVAEARGAILMTLARTGVPVYEYKPSQVKSVLTGYGAAGKAQMARMLGTQIDSPAAAQVPAGRGPQRPRTGPGAGHPVAREVRMDDHAVDAIAIALCHARSRSIRLAAAGGGR
ncbi:MAG: crossover junction endodeoxyribonuclease RuvC [Candidatus Dormibacteraceae bacterium]